MALLRWHTPNPPAPAPVLRASLLTDALRKSNDPLYQADPERWRSPLKMLERIMQRNHWDAYGTLDDLEVAERFNAKYPGEMVTPSRPGDVERHVYEWLSKLMTPAQVADALDEMRRREQDVSPYRQGSEDFFSGRKDKDVPAPPPADGEHAECDHYMPGGMVRHFHRVRSANNRGPPLPGDPYVGTGLDPINHTGIVAPNDGLPDEMACCGQRIPPGGPLPPGCWIAWEPQHREGKLHMYELWYQTQKPSGIWDVILQPNRTGAASLLQSLTRIGTAFLDLKYYQRLHDRIQRTLVKVLPTVIAFQNALINHNFDTTQVQWLPDERRRINKLVALVDLYNAPQLGACFHRGVAITDEWIAETILHIGTGRALHKTNKLNFVVQVAGARIERVKSVAQVRALVPVLRAAGASVTLLEDALALVPDAENEQRLLEADVERLRVTLPQIGGSSVSKAQSLYKAAKDLAAALGNLLENGLPGAVNTWLRENDGQDGSVGPEVVRVWADKMRAALTESREVHVTVRGAIEEAKHAAEAEAQRRTAEEAQRAEDKRRAKELKRREEEEAKRRAERIKELQREDEQRKRREAEAARQREREEQQRAKERQKEDEERKKQEAAAAKQKQKEDRLRAPPAVPAPSSLLRQERGDFDLPRTGKNKAMRMLPMLQVPWGDGAVVGGAAFSYDGLTCSYDAFFAALFKVPNQWLRECVRTAAQVHVRTGRIPAGERPCEQPDVLRLHNTLVKAIRFVEEGTHEPIPCPLPAIWKTCMRTSGERRDSPLALLNAVLYFYGVLGDVQTLAPQNHAAWVAQGVLRADAGRQMVIVEPVTQLEDAEYPVSVTLNDDAEYTLISVFVYRPRKPGSDTDDSHYETAIRDPRTTDWYMYRTSGQPERLEDGENHTFPPEVVRRVGAFFPVAWIYVRSERVAPLQVRLPTTFRLKDLSWEAWAIQQALLVPLFGAGLRGKQLVPLTSREKKGEAASFVGVMDILWTQANWDGWNGIQMTVPDWQPLPANATLNTEARAVERILVDRYLFPLVAYGRIGSNGQLSDQLLAKFRQACVRRGMAYVDKKTQRYMVPHLLPAARRKHKYLDPDPMGASEFLSAIEYTWAYLLHYLLFLMLENEDAKVKQAVESLEAIAQKTVDISTHLKDDPK